jgi:hypothetical protein
MKFSAAQYLQISDRLVEKAVPCEDVDAMGRLPRLENQLRHRVQQLEPSTSYMLAPSEIVRLRRNAQVMHLYLRRLARGRSWPKEAS